MDSVSLIRVFFLAFFASMICNSSAFLIPGDASGSASGSLSASLNVDQPGQEQFLTFPQPRPTPPPPPPPHRGPCYHGGVPHPPMNQNAYRQHQRRAVKEVIITMIPMGNMSMPVSEWLDQMKQMNDSMDFEDLKNHDLMARELYQDQLNQMGKMGQNSSSQPMDQEVKKANQTLQARAAPMEGQYQYQGMEGQGPYYQRLNMSDTWMGRQGQQVNSMHRMQNRPNQNMQNPHMNMMNQQQQPQGQMNHGMGQMENMQNPHMNQMNQGQNMQNPHQMDM